MIFLKYNIRNTLHPVNYREAHPSQTWQEKYQLKTIHMQNLLIS